MQEIKVEREPTVLCFKDGEVYEYQRELHSYINIQFDISLL